MNIIEKIRFSLPFQKKKRTDQSSDTPVTYTIFAGINGAGKTSLYSHKLNSLT